MSLLRSQSVLLKRWLLRLGLLLLALWLTVLMGTLFQAARSPVDGILVLGGSIQREIFVAQQRSSQVSSLTNVPILISQGSPDPCIWLIFERETAAKDAVWLEKCAQSTFDNFRFSLPILKRWGTHHVRLVTSAQHLARARAMGRILLGAHGIWVEGVEVVEVGRPGNQESPLKTVLDVSRSVAWAVVSQVYEPRCPRMVALAEVNMENWRARGFKCEHQAGLDADF